MKRLIQRTFRKMGFDLVRYRPNQPQEVETLQDLSEDQRRLISTIRPFTMTGPARIASLLNAVTYLSSNNVEGDIAECGVWRGGSMMAVALALLSRNDTRRSLYLYDTFEGMSAPTEEDKSLDGSSAKAQLENVAKGTGIWCYATLEDVRANMISTGYPASRIHLIRGKIEDTIPKTLPKHLALLRLDTDWYESTKHELEHLYPLLDQRGILIIDDYGHWQGAKKAVDEYLLAKNPGAYLHRIDYTARMIVGTGM